MLAFVCVEEGSVFVGVSCVCVWASVYVCICHSCDRKIFFASKDKNSLEVWKCCKRIVVLFLQVSR